MYLDDSSFLWIEKRAAKKKYNKNKTQTEHRILMNRTLKSLYRSYEYERNRQNTNTFLAFNKQVKNYLWTFFVFALRKTEESVMPMFNVHRCKVNGNYHTQTAGHRLYLFIFFLHFFAVFFLFAFITYALQYPNAITIFILIFDSVDNCKDRNATEQTPFSKWLFLLRCFSMALTTAD